MKTNDMMKKTKSAMKLFALSLALAVFGIGISQGQPVNNNFVNAIDLPGDSGVQSGTGNLDATLEAGEPGINGATNTVWFKWTCAADGFFTINTLGSTELLGGEFDSMVGVYTGTSVGALTALPGTPQDTGVPETMTVAVTAGTTYHIQVAGWDNTTAANIYLTWSFVGLGAMPLRNSPDACIVEYQQLRTCTFVMTSVPKLRCELNLEFRSAVFNTSSTN